MKSKSGSSQKMFLRGATLALVLMIGSIAAPASAQGLTEAQVQAIVSLLASFGADASVTSNVNAALRDQPESLSAGTTDTSPSSNTTNTSNTFVSNNGMPTPPPPQDNRGRFHGMGENDGMHFGQGTNPLMSSGMGQGHINSTSTDDRRVRPMPISGLPGMMSTSSDDHSDHGGRPMPFPGRANGDMHGMSSTTMSDPNQRPQLPPNSQGMGGMNTNMPTISSDALTMCPTITASLSQGNTDANTGGQVKQLQEFLTQQLGLQDNIVTGFFGPKTMQHLKEFQAQEGLDRAGRVGGLTRAAVARKCAEMLRMDPSNVPGTSSGNSGQGSGTVENQTNVSTSGHN